MYNKSSTFLIIHLLFNIYTNTVLSSLFYRLHILFLSLVNRSSAKCFKRTTKILQYNFKNQILVLSLFVLHIWSSDFWWHFEKMIKFSTEYKFHFELKTFRRIIISKHIHLWCHRNFSRSESFIFTCLPTQKFDAIEIQSEPSQMLTKHTAIILSTAKIISMQ